MQLPLTTLDRLEPGQRAIVDSFTDQEISLKLLEMGCLPGEEITIERVAPLGDPIAIGVSGCLLCIRRDEASAVLVRGLHV